MQETCCILNKHFQLSIFIICSVCTIFTTSCNSELSCHQPTMKFVSFGIIKSHALKGRVLSASKELTIFSCMLRCAQSYSCESANFLHRNKVCHTLADNRHSNASKLRRERHEQHLFRKGACDSSPCKNRGICHPDYRKDSYRCQCRSNNTFKTSGKHCETIRAGTKAADFYLNFEMLDKKGGVAAGPLKPGERRVYKKSNSAFITNHPSAGNHVLCLPGSGIVGLKFPLSAYSSCISAYQGCVGSSTTLWVKTQVQGDLLTPFIASGFLSSEGMYVGIMTLEHEGIYRFLFVCTVSDKGKGWFTVGYEVKEQELKRWHHLACVYKTTGQLLIYKNGKRKLTTKKNVHKGTVSKGGFLEIGQYYLKDRTKGYVDDIAMWSVPLTNGDIAFLLK